ncbi:type II toxin-antitoxin system HicA family toxin [Candidatus Micrarchaeota archaeon]|nr:type II toxin-antitoxin system HicA family toxin [Candidatus Micrarchaeota archaeon]
MPELPVLKLRTLLAILEKTGFTVESQRGSHIKLKKKTPQENRTVIVPNHAEIRKGTLGSILRQAGISREEFLRMLEK